MPRALPNKGPATWIRVAIPVVFVAIGLAALYFQSHHTRKELVANARRDLDQNKGSFDEGYGFCKSLAAEYGGDLSFFYRSGWDSLGIAITDSAGREVDVHRVPPDFLEGLYFNLVSVSVSFDYRADRLSINYPYFTYDDDGARIVHCLPPCRAIITGNNVSSADSIGEGWYVEIYKPDR